MLPATKRARIERDIQVAKQVRKQQKARGESTDAIDGQIRFLKTMAKTYQKTENSHANDQNSSHPRRARQPD